MPIVSALPKARSGIRGLDEITGGGLPRGRPTLVCGSAGAGKTLFAVEFLVRGIEMGEPHYPVDDPDRWMKKSLRFLAKHLPEVTR